MAVGVTVERPPAVFWARANFDTTEVNGTFIFYLKSSGSHPVVIKDLIQGKINIQKQPYMKQIVSLKNKLCNLG